jgi:hypothetical protein
VDVDEVMVLAITGYAFNKDIEDRGNVRLKLGLVRIQAARVAKKSQHVSSPDENSNIKYDGPIIRRKGDVYIVEANVTGSDCGTSNKLKFSLHAKFQDIIFPHLKGITAGVEASTMKGTPLLVYKCWAASGHSLQSIYGRVLMCACWVVLGGTGSHRLCKCLIFTTLT